MYEMWHPYKQKSSRSFLLKGAKRWSSVFIYLNVPRKQTLKSVYIKKQGLFGFIWDTREGKSFELRQTWNRLALNESSSSTCTLAYQKKIISSLEENSTNENVNNIFQTWCLGFNKKLVDMPINRVNKNLGKNR